VWISTVRVDALADDEHGMVSSIDEQLDGFLDNLVADRVPCFKRRGSFEASAHMDLGRWIRQVPETDSHRGRTTAMPSLSQKATIASGSFSAHALHETTTHESQRARERVRNVKTKRRTLCR
jgi:hypothetical protein